MTDRSSEGRSRTWTPLVEVIRREMLARFSDKLSMEEIASCAYAVAALEDRQEAASTDDERFHRAQSFLAATELIQAKCKAHGPNFPTTIPQIASFIVDFCKFKLSGVPSEATPSKKGPCPFASNSPWFQQHPELCRRCSGDGTVMVGGHSQELQDAVRSVCLHCEGTGKETCADQSPAPAPEVPIAPSKENEMVGSTGRIHKKTHDCETAGCRPAPAPEVQGTPTKEILAAKKGCEDCTPCPKCGDVSVRVFCRNCGEDLDAPVPEVQGTPTKNRITQPWVTREDLKSSCCKVAVSVGDDDVCTKCGNPCSHAPVGTPQKETPPVFIKRYTTEEARAAGLPVADGAVEILLYGSSVGAPPEGVQGKEPQTFDEFWAVKQPFDGDSPVGAKFWARKSWAAGRRSAITEMAKWEKAPRCQF